MLKRSDMSGTSKACRAILACLCAGVLLVSACSQKNPPAKEAASEAPQVSAAPSTPQAASPVPSPVPETQPQAPEPPVTQAASEPAAASAPKPATASPQPAPLPKAPAPKPSQSPAQAAPLVVESPAPRTEAPVAPAAAPVVQASPPVPVAPAPVAPTPIIPAPIVPAPVASTPIAPAPVVQAKPQASAPVAVPLGTARTRVFKDPAIDYAPLKEVTVPDLFISLPGGIYAGAQTIVLDCPLAEVSIRYTLDGSDPDPDKGTPYVGPIKVESSALFRAIAFIPGGKRSTIVRQAYTIGEILVRQGGKGEGGIDAPTGSIQAAIAAAKARGIGLVKVAIGEYREKVEIAQDIVLRGGYDASFATPFVGASTLIGPDVSGASREAPAFALRLTGRKVGSGARIEGLSVKGGEAVASAALLVDGGASPILFRCSFTGGSGSYTYGVKAVAQSEPRLERCRLDGGDGGSTFALSVDGSKALCYASFLSAGTGNVVSYAASLTDARASLVSCVLDGGAANTSFGLAAYSAPDVRAVGCTIHGGKGKVAYAVFVASSAPELRGCVIACEGSSKSWGIYENYGDSSPRAVERNAFLGCASGLYYDDGSRSIMVSVSPAGELLDAEGKALATPRSAGNLVGGFSIGAAPDRTGSGAALKKAGYRFEGFDMDVAGRKRGDSWSIGAYELP